LELQGRTPAPPSWNPVASSARDPLWN
jgi:hypothetical protein